MRYAPGCNSRSKKPLLVNFATRTPFSMIAGLSANGGLLGRKTYRSAVLSRAAFGTVNFVPVAQPTDIATAKRLNRCQNIFKAFMCCLMKKLSHAGPKCVNREAEPKALSC